MPMPSPLDAPLARCPHTPACTIAQERACLRERARAALLAELQSIMRLVESRDPTELRSLAQHVDGYWHCLVIGQADDIANLIPEREDLASDEPYRTASG